MKRAHLLAALFLITTGCDALIGAEFGTYRVETDSGAGGRSGDQADASGAGGSSSGGAMGSGGTHATGGTRSTGGAEPATGGAPDAPEDAGAGGASTGGAIATGGASSGGAPGSGGASSGGAATGGALGSGGAPCVTDLSDVGTGDFHIFFTVTTTATTAVALVNQNATCQACGGTVEPEWDVFLYTGGLVEIETDDGIANNRAYVLAASVTDGKPHHIEAARTSGQLWIKVDGASSPAVPDDHSIGKLPPLVVGSDPCVNSLGNPGCPPVKPFVGTLADLCITR